MIDNLWTTFGKSSDTGIAYLFCSYKRQQEQKFENLIANLLKQLVQEQDVLPNDIETLHQRHSKRGTRPSTTEILSVLHSVAGKYSRVLLVIDALDEYPSVGRTQLLRELFKLQAAVQANLLVTSRFLPDILGQFSSTKSLKIRASPEDVERYLSNQVLLLPGFVLRNAALQQKIVTDITKASDGMYVFLAQNQMIVCLYIHV